MARAQKQIIDAYLVSCAALGDRTAQEQLVHRYQSRFLRHAFRLLGEADMAKDAVQDGWLEILRGLSGLKDETAFPAWSFRIITRKCARQIKNVQKTRRTADGLSNEPEPENHGHTDIELAAERKPLQSAMANLSAEHRAAVALFYLEEMSVAETAVALDIPTGTVKSRLLHARRKMRAALEGEYHG